MRIDLLDRLTADGGDSLGTAMAQRLSSYKAANWRLVELIDTLFLNSLYFPPPRCHRVQLVGGLLVEPLVRGSNLSGARVQCIEGTVDRELLNPWSGDQTPSCPECSSAVGFGPHMSKQGTPWHRFSGNEFKNHPTLTGQDTRDWATWGLIG